MAVFNYGSTFPRLRLLAADGSTVEATLFLPFYSNGGISQTLEENKTVNEMLDGRLDVEIKGYYHKFKIKWEVYDETTTALTVGIADGNTPNAAQLLQLLTQYRPGRILFSPSSTDVFYKVYVDKMPVLQVVQDYAVSFEAELKTLDIYTSADNTAAKELA